MTLVPWGEGAGPSELASGDSPEWGRWVPAMWQALADPTGDHPWPGPPKPGGEPFDGQCAPAFWVPGIHLLQYSLGWADPGRGLRRWMAAGRPTDDHRLALLDAMLGPRTDDLVAWYWDQEPNPTDPHRPDPGWLDDVRRRAGPWSPSGGPNSDPMHLTGHGRTPEWADESDRPLLTFDRPRRRAVLVVVRYAGWYSHLRTLGAALPTRPDGRSWRVEVVCRPVGSLGVFRLSSASGRWFAGRHRHHELGVRAQRNGGE